MFLVPSTGPLSRKNSGLLTNPSSQKATSMHQKLKRISFPSFFVGLVIAAILVIIIELHTDKFNISYLILLSFSAAFASSDFIDALRKKSDILAPRALLSIIMLIGVFIAPIIHISQGINPSYVSLPENMEVAFENLAIVHLLGLFLYFITLRIPRKNAPTDRPAQSKQLINLEFISYSNAMLTAGLFSLAVFAYYLFTLGGPVSWLNAQLNYRESALGPGWLIAIAEAFPSLFFMSYILKLHPKNLSDNEIKKRVVIAFLLLVVVIFVTSGLRGSRANLVWPALTALLLIHILLTRIKMQLLVFLSIGLLIFSGVYDIYKKAGTEGLITAKESGIQSVEENANYSFGLTPLLTGDFSRSAIQAIALDRWNEGTFQLFNGRTYVGDAIEFVPGAEVSETFPNKRVAATEILYGEGSSQTKQTLDSRIYGLQGEALMNFGPIGATVVLVPFALIVRRSERVFEKSKTTKSPSLAVYSAILAPIIVLLFLSDFDNVLYNFTSNALAPILSIQLGKIMIRANLRNQKAV